MSESFHLRILLWGCTCQRIVDVTEEKSFLFVRDQRARRHALTSRYNEVRPLCKQHKVKTGTRTGMPAIGSSESRRLGMRTRTGCG